MREVNGAIQWQEQRAQSNADATDNDPYGDDVVGYGVAPYA